MGIANQRHYKNQEREQRQDQVVSKLRADPLHIIKFDLLVQLFGKGKSSSGGAFLHNALLCLSYNMLSHIFNSTPQFESSDEADRGPGPVNQ
ncbi:hypothetical protein D3C85_1666990 [compost metagenome]